MVRSQPTRGEIWLVDLGLAQKTRPVVIMSVKPTGDERVVVSYIARTTSTRGTQYEVPHEAPGFKPGVFDAQSIGTIPVARLLKRIGTLDADTFGKVQTVLKSWLDF